VAEVRASYGDSIARVLKNADVSRRLITRVAQVVRTMPLRYLQNVGGERLDFLYGEVGHVIELRPGVAYCFRKFHALISDLVRGAWLRYVRQQNLDVLGETADLNEFLFGSERNNLLVVRPVLMDIQRGRCFYCGAGIAEGTAQVDHFISWSRYPADLAHNFVLAHQACNGKKGDRLPAYKHLAAWAERNAKYGLQVGKELERRGVVANLAASNRVAHWAHAQTEAVQGLTWMRADEMVPLAEVWREFLS
jgi:5-methylcytosine-specific restriction endonuclease McrA